MKKILHTILMLIMATAIWAQTFKVRECTEGEIPLSARADYYKTVERYLDIYYQMLPGSIGNAENRDAIISNVMANRDGKTLKTEFLLDDTKDLSYVSPMQYYVKFENVFSQMADDIEFVVDNVSHGKIMMNSLVSCFIPVDYDLTLMKGEDILFKRRCRMTFLFQKIAISSIAKTMQVEPLKDIIAYRPRLQDAGFKQQYEQAVKWYSEGNSQKSRYQPVFKSLAEKGYTDAEWHYSLCLLDEDSTRHAEAVAWLQKAVDKNHPKALNTLGWCYREGVGLSRDFQKAFEYFKRSAMLGWKTGANNMARAYKKGQGCTQDISEAEKWYVKASDLGSVYSYGDCADMFWNINRNKAREYILKGIEKKDIYCYALLGECYINGGLEFPIDYDKAAESFKYVVDFRQKDGYRTFDKQFYDLIDKLYQEVKPWYDSKPEKFLSTFWADKNNMYIAKVKAYKSKKKDLDKYNKAILQIHSKPDASLKTIKKLADAGMPEALAYMGGYWYKNKLYNRAYHMYVASALGLYTADALNGLADCYYYGKHVNKDIIKAVRLYEWASNIDTKKTRFELGYCYYTKKNGLPDNNLAPKYLQHASLAGNANAKYYLGMCYEYGKGVKQDYAKAFQFYKEASVKIGLIGAQSRLGLLYFNGQGIPRNYQEAVKWLTKAAQAGDVISQSKLGECYFYGKGVEQSYAKAVEWYTKAAKQGNAEAQYYLGYCYNAGHGVQQSYDKAVEWYTKSAEKGYVSAMTNLGVLYDNGQGVPQSYEKAVEWFTKAAEKDNMYSQYNLGLCCQYGTGTKKSMANAVEWFFKAAAKGHEEATKKIKGFQNKYTATGAGRKPLKTGQYAGIVYDDKGPVADALVFVKDTDVITKTDAQGRFFISYSGKGNIKIGAGKIGVTIKNIQYKGIK